MDVGLINNSETWTGLGRYANSIFLELLKDEDINVDHIYLNWGSKKVEILRDRSNPESTTEKTRSIPAIKYLWYALKQGRIPNHTVNHIMNQNISYLKLKNKIVTVHDVFHITDPRTPLHKSFALMVYSGIEESSHIITVSDFSKKKILESYDVNEDDITVIYHGIDKRYFSNDLNFDDVRDKFHIPRTAKYFFHISNEQKHKNFDKAILAFSDFLKNSGSKDYYLVKAGKALYPKDREKHLAMTRELGISDRVIFINRVSEDELIKLYKGSRCLLFPSSREGFGFPPLESMAAGTPVISSNSTSIGEIVGDAGLVINPEDISEFAGAMIDISNNDNLWGSLRNRGFSRASEFTWEEAAKKTKDTYNKVLGLK